MPTAERETIERIFREQMTTYDSHWRDDPYFDCTNTVEAAPHLPCPIADREMLLRTSRFAVGCNFGWPRPQPIQLEFDASACLRPLVQAADEPAGLQTSGQKIGLQVTGPGGGQWSVTVDGAATVAAQAGLRPDCGLRYHLNSRTFQALTQRRITVEQAVYAGAVVIEGSGPVKHETLDILRNIVALPL